uniref:Uncharacterized protein n=1 Tax=Anopheles coluzzii TaxID=1518534 RepID=A0A8W7Q3N8_ANOCL
MQPTVLRPGSQRRRTLAVVDAELLPEVVHLHAIARRLAGQQIASDPVEVLAVLFQPLYQLLDLVRRPPAMDGGGRALQHAQYRLVYLTVRLQQGAQCILLRVATQRCGGRTGQLDEPLQLAVVWRERRIPEPLHRRDAGLERGRVGRARAVRQGRLIVGAEVDARPDRQRRLGKDIARAVHRGVEIGLDDRAGGRARVQPCRAAPFRVEHRGGRVVQGGQQCRRGSSQLRQIDRRLALTGGMGWGGPGGTGDCEDADVWERLRGHTTPPAAGWALPSSACCSRGDATDESDSEEEEDEEEEQLCEDRLLGLRNTLSASFGIGSVWTVSGALLASAPNVPLASTTSSSASLTSAADDMVAEKKAFDSGEDALRVSSMNTCASSRKSRFILDVPSADGFDSAKNPSSVLNSSEQCSSSRWCLFARNRSWFSSSSSCLSASIFALSDALQSPSLGSVLKKPSSRKLCALRLSSKKEPASVKWRESSRKGDACATASCDAGGVGSALVLVVLLLPFGSLEGAPVPPYRTLKSLPCRALNSANPSGRGESSTAWIWRDGVKPWSLIEP